MSRRRLEDSRIIPPEVASRKEFPQSSAAPRLPKRNVEAAVRTLSLTTVTCALAHRAQRMVSVDGDEGAVLFVEVAGGVWSSKSCLTINGWLQVSGSLVVGVGKWQYYSGWQRLRKLQRPRALLIAPRLQDVWWELFCWQSGHYDRVSVAGRQHNVSP